MTRITPEEALHRWLVNRGGIPGLVELATMLNDGHRKKKIAAHFRMSAASFSQDVSPLFEIRYVLKPALVDSIRRWQSLEEQRINAVITAANEISDGIPRHGNDLDARTLPPARLLLIPHKATKERKQKQRTVPAVLRPKPEK